VRFATADESGDAMLSHFEVLLSDEDVSRTDRMASPLRCHGDAMRSHSEVRYR
jgi:hypothetical protein